MPKAILKDDFSNLLQYRQWLEHSWEYLSPLNRHHKSRYTEKEVDAKVRSDPNWYGTNTSYRELAEGITLYKDPELIERIYSKVSDKLSTGIINRIKKRKLDFNALGLGVFSFDRAAMTLYRAKTQRNNIVVRTATKDLFAWFPQESRDRHAVEIFISCDVPGLAAAKDMLYAGIAAVILAEMLTLAGIRVKINIVNGSALTNGRELYVGCVVPVKDYEEPVDRNLIALLTSDPRFMRYDAFKGAIGAFDHFKMEMPPSMGFPMNAIQLKNLLETSGYSEKLQSMHRYYFGGTLSEDRAIRDISMTIDDLAEKLEQ
ncbi:hypothetical protein [Chitinophaga agri]|uniref:Uncharacterized protein n=1 Tax=Chitinophaga agri TaxID=2703787 RepID=A0A6B9ZEP3_9BACT|nr:hypothetical protein [Chitinophaga agri]QHS60840.1 hypothetical protein GWR21_14915 [Chitinophaga agri]